MAVRVNIDYPTKIGRVHREESQNLNCQPKAKIAEDGYWSRLPNVKAAEDLIRGEGVAFEYCKNCFT